jgi:hypothetical protein
VMTMGCFPVNARRGKHPSLQDSNRRHEPVFGCFLTKKA